MSESPASPLTTTTLSESATITSLSPISLQEQSLPQAKTNKLSKTEKRAKKVEKQQREQRRESRRGEGLPASDNSSIPSDDEISNHSKAEAPANTSQATLALVIKEPAAAVLAPTPSIPTQPTKANSTRAERRALHKAQNSGQNSSISSNPRVANMPPPRLLIASIGNPAPYLSTLHSAGHLVLTSLSSTLGGSSWAKSRAHGNGLLSTAYVDTSDGSAQVTMWQSPSLMNVSGPAVASAWRAFLKEGGEEVPHLVVLHDEMETGLGKLRVRPGTNSPKGHNGLKSIKGSLAGLQYTRIGLGIGRPVSREPDEVARFVLRKWTQQEREALLGSVGSVADEITKMLERGV